MIQPTTTCRGARKVRLIHYGFNHWFNFVVAVPGFYDWLKRNHMNYQTKFHISLSLSLSLSIYIYTYISYIDKVSRSTAFSSVWNYDNPSPFASLVLKRKWTRQIGANLDSGRLGWTFNVSKSLKDTFKHTQRTKSRWLWILIDSYSLLQTGSGTARWKAEKRPSWIFFQALPISEQQTATFCSQAALS